MQASIMQATTQIQIGDLCIHVALKDIKNIHLGVYPPDGMVRISAPLATNLEHVRLFALSKLSWIRHQQKKLRDQPREAPREYLERETHYLWGERHLLQLLPTNTKPSIEASHNVIQMRVRPATREARKKYLMEEWYRAQLKAAIEPLIEKWQPLMDVQVQHFAVRKMKTLWGSCQPQTATIRLNLELAKKPRPCLEYIVVHEMIHLLEPTHNARFVSLMDKFLPQWRSCRALLNELPVRNEHWKY